MKNNPLVSIVLPVYKSERHLESCLESLSSQNYKNIEIIAVVDYLGDESLKILKRYKKIDKRLRVYSNLQRYGLASTLNRLIRLSKGQYIAFMDSQGIALKSRISKQVKFLNENPKIAAVGTQAIILNNDNKKLLKTEFPETHDEIYGKLLAGLSMKFESVMIDRTRLPKDILKFKRNSHYPFVYTDVFMKIGLYNNLANLKENLVNVREIGKENNEIFNLDKKLSFIKLLFDSTTNYEYKPNIKALFSPILKLS